MRVLLHRSRSNCQNRLVLRCNRVLGVGLVESLDKVGFFWWQSVRLAARGLAEAQAQEEAVRRESAQKLRQLPLQHPRALPALHFVENTGNQAVVLAELL